MQSWHTFDDDDDEMPTERSTDVHIASNTVIDDEDRRKFHYKLPSASAAAPLASTSTGRPNVEAKNTAVDLDYTRLELDDDPEEDAIHLRTAYLFDDDRGMTPLDQMQQTKNLLTEAQRIAYVALCRLVTKEMVAALQVIDQTEKLKPGQARRPMKDLATAAESAQNWATKVMGRLYHHMDITAPEQRMIEQLIEHGIKVVDVTPSLIATHNVPNPEYDPTAAREKEAAESPVVEKPDNEWAADRSPGPQDVPLPTSRPSSPLADDDDINQLAANALPGVSTSLSTTDEEVTLDMRYTVICDLFLSLISDSIYDSRSRVLLATTAESLGLGLADLVRFERRLTEALELQEGVATRDDGGVLEDVRQRAKKRRYAMMGLAAIGGGLVIGLSAGLLAPVIGAGLGAAFTTIGVTGTGTFLAGTGGAAIITTGGVITGARVGSKGMGRRTQQVKTFELVPLHNNKRLNVFIMVPGFMNGPTDDVRLPFSVLEPVIGDVFCTLWEPEMLGETGSTLKILTSEIITQVGQQILQATLMTALMSALQWPILLTKLGYLIDNPWSNALDRSWAAGQVLADVLIKRHVGVRPVSLIGFSLGARVIFYALEALAKKKAFGVVQDVILLGATVTASTKTWRTVRGVVAGRFVNGYSTTDWILGYLFRATAAGLSSVAGLRPVEDVPGIENVDLTELVVGHMSYRACMPIILQYLGFKVTADEFDEIEEEEGPEREVVSKEEEIRRHAEREKRRVFGLTAWRKGQARAHGEDDKSDAGSVDAKRQSSTEKAANDDDEDLPPREDHAVVFDIEAIRAVAASADPGMAASTDALPLRTLDEASLPRRPASAGGERFEPEPTPLRQSIDYDDDEDTERSSEPDFTRPDDLTPTETRSAWPHPDVDDPYRFRPADEQVGDAKTEDVDDWRLPTPTTRVPTFANAWDDDPKW